MSPRKVARKPKPTAAAQAPHVHFPHRAALRDWLEKHHASHPPIWLVYDKAGKGAARSLTYDDIVEEALCFGWIDSVSGSVDATQAKLYFSPRKPKSGWSARNKKLIESLRGRGLMMAPGEAKIQGAMGDGSWTLLDAIEALEVPPDLAKALKAAPEARAHFEAFPRGVRKRILAWVYGAKRAETRATRVETVVRLAAQNIRATEPTPAKGVRAGKRSKPPR
ncbi:MAG: YdeI/OmpD-associated family protein [Phycisphaerales bacterium]|jgi:uncharacterized protein YdeI (YjbR/CyaY-like superfamily)